MTFKPAVKEKLKARLVIEGPSGSGKTMSALLIARGLVGKSGTIAMIDTEQDSGKLYADTTNFDHCSLDAPYSPERYIQLISDAEKAGYDCLIIDSMSHEWSGTGGILEIHDSMPGNSYTNWGKVNPRHNAFINAMLRYNGHIIVTCRSKQAYVLETNEKGKQEPKKVGLAPQQRDGIEYEFTAVLKMERTHQAEGDKDRTGLFPVGYWFVPSEETGKSLSQWLDSGVEIQKVSLLEKWKQEADTKQSLEDLKVWRAKIGKQVRNELNSEDQKTLLDYLNKLEDKLSKGPTVNCPDQPDAYVPESYCKECSKRNGCPEHDNGETK